MPETKREGIILGEVSRTSSSDEAISAKLDDVKNQVFGVSPTGLTDLEVIDDNNPVKKPLNGNVDSSPREVTSHRITKLNVIDSRPWGSLVDFRSKRRKAA